MCSGIDSVIGVNSISQSEIPHNWGLGIPKTVSRAKALLTKRAQAIEDTMATLQAELALIKAALNAIGDGSTERVGQRSPGIKRTISILTEEILSDHPEGLRTAEIVQVLNTAHKRAISRRNMSWHLSKMRREGALTREGPLWRLRGQAAVPAQ